MNIVAGVSTRVRERLTISKAGNEPSDARVQKGRSFRRSFARNINGESALVSSFHASACESCCAMQPGNGSYVRSEEAVI
jgi:hypothetical protein